MKLSSQTVSYPNGSFHNLFIGILLILVTSHICIAHVVAGRSTTGTRPFS